MKKNLTMQLLPLWLLAFFFFASVPIKAQTYSEATPRIGIVKMIGCGTGTEANKAQIQVIHDGTGYSYNFGANASAQSGSTAWLPAGTHTVTVTKGSRTYKLPITVPAKVVPTFTPTVTYNCNGTADVRLTNNQGTYNYTYTYGGNTHNSPYFRDLAVGQHTITVKYTQPIAERDIVFFDDFGTKETGDPKAVRSKYAISTMNFAPLNGTQVQPNGVVINTVNLRNDACYTVATKADADTENVPTTWLYPNDKDGKANGRYLYYDAYTINQNLYTRKAKVKPNTPVNFSAYLFNTVKTTYNSGLGATYTVRVTLDIYANEAAAQAGTAPLFRSYYFNVPAATTDADKWYPINVTANISGSYSELVFVVRMYGDSLNGGIGNDIALDNVLVTQPTAICEQTLAVPVNVVTNTNTYSTTVTYNCAANNATIKVTPSVTTGYTYTYKLDNGTAGSNNTFNNVAVGVHTLTLTSQYTGAKVIFKEDFGSGAPYRLPETVVPKPFVCKDVLYGYPADILPEGHYQVANVNNLTQMNTWNWRSPKDHTNSTDGQGRYLAFNHGANANKPFYKQDIRVEANKPVTVEYYAYNINKNSTVDLPKIKVKLVNKATNAVVHTSSTYAVTGNTSDTDWRKVTFTFTPPVNARDLELNFINEENSEGSNDFAIDDILVTQAYDTCSATVTATVAPKVTRAFAGVTKLIGCGTGANANKAEVKVSNVQGATGSYTYEYRFGSSGSWVATNTGWLEAGTHTVSVRAKGTGNSCVYDMSVTVSSATTAPIVSTQVFYDCDGKPILKVNIANEQPTYQYQYKLDSGAYTTTSIFTNITSGTHTIKVKYYNTEVPSPFLLLREDFGVGPEGQTLAQVDPNARIASNYRALTIQQYCGVPGRASMDGYYITKGTAVITNSCWGNYVGGAFPSNVPYDNTPSTTPNGRYMMIDLQTTGEVYEKDIYDVLPGRKTVMSVDFYNLILASMTGRRNPLLTLQVFDKNTGVKIAESSQIDVPQGSTWSKSTFSFVTPATTTAITFKLYSHRNDGAGNDLAFDNIEIYQTPEACGQEVTATATVTPLAKPSFSANVSNCSNTNSTITWVASPTTGYTYTYTLQGGTATSSNVFNGLATGNHTFTIDYAPTANIITLLNEDFGAGTDAVKNQYVGKEWYFNNNTAAGYTAYNGYGQTQAHSAGAMLWTGEYTIAKSLLIKNIDWRDPVDHSGKPNGRVLFVDGASAATKQDVYTRKVSVVPNTPLTFNASFISLVDATKVAAADNQPPYHSQVQLQLYENEAAYLANQTPAFQNNIYYVSPSTSANDWRTQTLTLTGAQVGNRTQFYAVIRMHNVSWRGHDLAVDDIIVKQTIGCKATVTATVQNQVQKAFAGVTKLIGCGTGANASLAEVTIANVEGGSGTYEYQFDGLTWTNTNTGWLSAGTHTVSVRDSVTKSCAYDMSVTVPAALAQPTIKTAVHYACDGKAILNIGVENPDPALKYLYSLDGAAYTTTYVYTGVASGTHSVSVQYEHRSVPSPVMLLKETFGSDNADTCLPNPSMTTYVCEAGKLTVPIQGGYGIINGHSGLLNRGVVPCSTPKGNNAADVWVPVKDHTTMGADPNGRFFMVDARYSSGVGDLFYKKKVKNIPLNSNINIEFFILNLFREDNKNILGIGDAVLPNIRVLLVDNGGNEIMHFDTGAVPNSVCGAGLDNWKRMQTVLNSGNHSEFTIEFRANQTVNNGWGNDFCIDDITVFVEPKACGQVVSTTQIVTANGQDIPAFTVSKTYDCATGKGALTVTPTATTGFTYTYTLGTTTYTSTTATFTGLDLEQTYTVSISYQAVSNTVTLLNEDFGAGTTPIRSPYVGKNLYFNENTSAAYTSYNANGQSRAHAAGTFLKEEEYCIADHIAIRSYDWDNPSDHTGKTNGRMLYINGISAVPTQEVYARQVNVVPNLPLTFTTSFYNLIHNPAVLPPKTPRVNIALYESEAAYRANANNVITQTTILDIPSTGNKWETQTITLTAAQVANRTTMYAVVRMHNVLSSGHDLAIDDIVITQKLPACTTSVTATLTKGDVATPTLTLPANLSVICSAPTASATISSWIASATATSTCGTATVTHNYSYPSNLCNVSGGAVTVTFSTTDPFGNVVTATRVISFATMTLTVTPTTLSVPNGALGGTTSSVVPNITLGGVASPSTNSVTITFSGLPTGVTSTTGGRLIVAPNTPAGSHTITYRVCETAGHNNCKTVNTQLVIGTGSLTVTPVTPLTVPNGISGGTTSSVLTGITLNGATVTNTNSVTISFSGLPTGVTSNTNGQLVIPAGTPAGTHTITYKVCEKLNPTNCQTVTSTLVIGTGSLTVTPVTPLTVPNGISGGTTSSVLTGTTLNGATVTNTNSVTISFSGLPTGVTSNTNGQLVIPAGTPAGTHTITYRVCEKLNPTNCHTVTSTLVIGTGSLTVTPVMPLTVPNGISGGTTSSVLTGVRLNGNVVTNTNSVTISFSGLPAGVTTDTQGRIVVPAGTPATSTLVTYRVCEKLNSTNCQTVTSTLVIGTGSLTVTPVTPLTVPNGISGGTTSSVLTGITLNGTTVTNTNSVTISFSGLPTGVTSNTNGQLVIPAGAPAGTHTITYKVCEKLNPTNCQTVTSTLVIGTGSLTVTPVTPLTVPNGISGGTTSSVLTGITLNGTTVTNTNSVTISFSGLPTGVTSNTNGQLVIPAGTPAGTHTITYKVCEKLNPTNCQTVTSTLVIGTGSLTVTPVTPLTVPNGISGGTTSSVLTGITLNGATVTNTNSVTISFSGLPTGVTSNTNGQLVIPAGTPAGTHTITYKVCEKLNPTNCQTVTSTLVIGTGSLTVTPVTPLTVPNGISGGTTSSVLTGITLNGATVTNTNSVTISFSGLPTGVTTNTNGQLVIPAGTPAGTHTITYRVCEKLNPTNCQTVTSTLVIGTGSLTVTSTTLTHPNGTQGGTTTGTVLTGVKINGNPVNTASVTITWNSLPPNATGNASGTVTIAPNTPAGTYTISYTVCERLNGNSNCQSVTSQITIGGGSLTATPTNLTHPNGTQGGTTTGTVLTGVKINGNPVNTASVTITWNSLPPNATGNASGTVTIAPNTPAGTYTISYTVCERLNGNSNCQSVTSQITIGGGNMTVTPTQLIVANGATGGTSVNNVLTGVTINGNPVNTNSVTITWNSLPPGFTGTNSGTVTVPANTPAGTYTVSYTVCERLNQNNNCKTVTSTITVGNGNMIVVPTPITVPNGTIGGTSTPSVLTGVVLNGNSNPAPNTVSITWDTLPPRATGNNDGTVNVAPNTPAGTYTVSYTICEALNNGHCTTVTSTITIGGGVLTVTPVTTLTVANGAQGGTTTSSVLTGVSLNGQPANSQSVTITFTGLPAGVTSNTNGQLVVAPGTPATNTTIYYTVCETLNANNNCHTYSTTLVIGTPSLSVTPRTYVIPDATVGGTTSSVLETITIDGHTPSSQSVTITFGNLPVGIQTTTSGGFRVPAGTPTGIHTVTYTVCEVLNPDHCVTSIATIAVGNVPVVTPNAFTYTGTATVTTPSILDDDTIGTQSATTGTGGNVVINITSTPTGTVVPSLDANNGRVTIPAGTPPGIYTITYDVCTTATPTACTPGAVVITIPNVPVITPDDMVYTDTTTTTAGNILTNDRVGTQSATAGNGGNVSITVTIPATPKAPGATVPTLNPNTGVVTVPAGTPSGTYTITYKICTTATPTSCDTGVVTITVSGTVTEAPDTNDVTAYTRINTPVTVGVTSSTTVTVSIPSQPANGTAVSNGDGTITYTPNNGFKGTDSFEYSLCNAAGCRTATISVRVTSELIIYNGVSIGGSDKNNHFHIEGIENYPNNTVRIYNRWGVKVFEMSGYNNTTKAFKGVSDARATLEASDNLPQGTYYYIIEYVDEHNKTQTETGWLYLKKN